MRTLPRWLSLLCVMLLISACGFQLRGYKELPLELHVLYLQTATPNAPVTRFLASTLQALHIEMTAHPEHAPLVLEILHEGFHANPISVSIQTQLRQYRLLQTLEFRLVREDGLVIIPKSQVSSSRTLTVNANQVLASTSEQSTLQHEMQQEVVRRLIDRLSADDTRHALLHPPVHPAAAPK